MKEKPLSPREIVDRMMSNDLFSQTMGMRIISCEKGIVNVSTNVAPTHTNGFKIAHGGITYALADSALAFSSNTHGKHALSINTSIQHLAPVQEGDQIQTEVLPINLTSRIGVYEINIFNQNQKKVAFFTGTVYFKSTSWANEC